MPRKFILYPQMTINKAFIAANLPDDQVHNLDITLSVYPAF
jgi:hypothetical protein